MARSGLPELSARADRATLESGATVTTITIAVRGSITTPPNAESTDGPADVSTPELCMRQKRIERAGSISEVRRCGT